jgi:integrase/recombinase XerD
VPLGDAAAGGQLPERAPVLLKNGASDFLFISARRRGSPWQMFWERIKLHARTAGITFHFAPHAAPLFATHLLDNGADRSCSAMLGHSDFHNADLYACIAERLSKIHESHHPRGGEANADFGMRNKERNSKETLNV